MKRILMMLPLFVVSLFLLSCNDDDDDDNKVKPEGATVELSEDSKTEEDFYFDGSLYYRIISESKKTAAVARAAKTAKVVEIPAIIVLKGKKYTVVEIDSKAFAVGPIVDSLPSGYVESVTFPNTIRTSGLYAFSGCNNLKKVVANDLVSWCKIDFEHLGNPLCNEGCLYLRDGSKISELVIPESITAIKEDAFMFARGITKVVIHDRVKEIGNDAFSLCKDLNSVSFGSGLRTIGSFAFFGCEKIKSINIPDNVTTIEDNAFHGCKGATDIVMGSGVKKIESRTFAFCEKLKNITLGKNVTEIESEALRYCLSLENVTLPDKVTTLSSSVFVDSKNLKSVTLPDALTNLGHEMFDGCVSLNTIYSHIKNPEKVNFFPYGVNFFNSSNITLYVPIGTKDAYKSIDNWNVFKNIVEKEGL